MARPVRQPLRVFRRDSGDAAIAQSGTSGPVGVPIYGFTSIVIFARTLAAGKIEISQYLKGSSTAIETDELSVAAAGAIAQTIEVVGEVANIVWTQQDATARKVEIIVSLQ